MARVTPAADAAARTTGASLMRGGAWTAVSHVIPQIYTLAVSIAAARFLGPAEFGRQSFIAFVAIAVLMVLTSGLALALMRSVAEAGGAGRADEARGLVAWAWRVQAVAALLGGGGLVHRGGARRAPGGGVDPGRAVRGAGRPAERGQRGAARGAAVPLRGGDRARDRRRDGAGGDRGAGRGRRDRRDLRRRGGGRRGQPGLDVRARATGAERARDARSCGRNCGAR